VDHSTSIIICYYRDFVTIRYWECRDGVYYAVGKAVTHDSMPSQSGKIRLVTRSIVIIIRIVV